MTCRLPPVSASAFDQASAQWPGRSTASDGTCPSRAHSSSNPSSDHEPDHRLNSYSCAFDLTHDPAHGADAHGPIAEWLRWRCSTGVEWRVKYLIRHNFRAGHDEIAQPSNGWQWNNAHQDQHASHLHISLVHDMHVLMSTAAWFTATPTGEPMPEIEKVPRAFMAFPDEPMLKPRTYRGKRPTFLIDANLQNAQFLTTRDVTTLVFLGADDPIELPREFIEGRHHLSRMDGRTS